MLVNRPEIIGFSKVLLHPLSLLFTRLPPTHTYTHRVTHTSRTESRRCGDNKVDKGVALAGSREPLTFLSLSFSFRTLSRAASPPLRARWGRGQRRDWPVARPRRQIKSNRPDQRNARCWLFSRAPERRRPPLPLPFRQD